MKNGFLQHTLFPPPRRKEKIELITIEISVYLCDSLTHVTQNANINATKSQSH